MADAGVRMIRSFHHADNHFVYQPSLCITLQGAKEILVGEETLRYGPMQCLIVGVDLPAHGRIVAASPDEPFVGVAIGFDVVVMREVLEQLDTRRSLLQAPAGACSLLTSMGRLRIASCA